MKNYKKNDGEEKYDVFFPDGKQSKNDKKAYGNNQHPQEYKDIGIPGRIAVIVPVLDIMPDIGFYLRKGFAPDDQVRYPME
jgi:hypothetical protein